MNDTSHGPNIENRSDLADWRHPSELLEPEEESPRSALAEMLGTVLAEVFSGATGRKMDPQASFNRLITLAWVIRPDLLDGKSLMALGEELGITRAALSKNALRWTDLLGGYRNGGQKSEHARRSYSEAQAGHRNYRSDARQLNRKIEQRIHRLREDFLEGRKWKQVDKDFLRRRGLIGGGDRLTEAGQTWIQGSGRVPTPAP